MERTKLKTEFSSGDKVFFVLDKKLYDFGYYGSKGHGVIYKEGECNMQDSYAVKLEDIIKINN